MRILTKLKNLLRWSWRQTLTWPFSKIKWLLVNSQRTHWPVKHDCSKEKSIQSTHSRTVFDWLDVNKESFYDLIWQETPENTWNIRQTESLHLCVFVCVCACLNTNFYETTANIRGWHVTVFPLIIWWKNVFTSKISFLWHMYSVLILKHLDYASSLRMDVRFNISENNKRWTDTHIDFDNFPH